MHAIARPIQSMEIIEVDLQRIHTESSRKMQNGIKGRAFYVDI